MLRQIKRQRNEGLSVLVYEHLPSSDVWLIEDPGLKLGELSAVQDEVAHLLAPADGGNTAESFAPASAIPAEIQTEAVEEPASP